MVGMLWFMVRIFAPVSAKIASRELNTPFLSRSSAWKVTMLPRFISRKGITESLYL